MIHRLDLFATKFGGGSIITGRISEHVGGCSEDGAKSADLSAILQQLLCVYNSAEINEFEHYVNHVHAD